MSKIKKHIKPDIKGISEDFRLEDLGYIPNPPTDDDIYYFWGRKLIGGIEMKPLSWSKEAKELLHDNPTKQEIIDYARKVCIPILPDDQEYIPRKYWVGLDELVGENLGVLNHPIWQITNTIIRETWKPTSQNLIVQACANNKPYIENKSFSFVLQRHKEGFCDVVVNSIELVPLEYTYCYPFRHYDWANVNEIEFVTDALYRRKVDNILRFVREFNYKKVIIYGTPLPDKGYELMYNELVKQFKGTDVEVYLVNDAKMSADILANEGCNNLGLVKTRWFNYYIVKRRVDELIGYNGPNPVPTYDEINKMRQMRNHQQKVKKMIQKSGFNFGNNKKTP